MSGEQRIPAEDTTSVISQIVSNVTHELKTPLHSILALAQLLDSEADGALSAEQHKQVSMILRNGERLLELIQDLLDFSRVESRSRRTEIEEVPVAALIDSEIQSLETACARGEVKIEKDVCGLRETFGSDRALLRQIIHNLLSNAVKFSPRGGVVSLSGQSLSQGELLLEIADQGAGIPPDAQEAVFREFYQVDSSDGRKFGGVGLGLSLVRRAVDLLEGTIELRSEPGRGALFRVELPSLESKIRRAEVLVVEEDDTLAEALCLALSQSGFGVRRVRGRDEALYACAEGVPNVIVFSETRGDLGLLTEIRSSGWGKDVPIVVISAFDGPADRARGFEKGASDYLVKPFDMGEAVARVRKQVGR